MYPQTHFKVDPQFPFVQSRGKAMPLGNLRTVEDLGRVAINPLRPESIMSRSSSSSSKYKISPRTCRARKR